MNSFQVDSYGPAFKNLLSGSRLCELGPGQPQRAAYAQLSELDTETAFQGYSVCDPDMASCCLSGVWLLHNYLDESHSISQHIATSSGSYWHGIMHRREPDYSNAKYWFRRVGPHPVFESLVPAARQATAELEAPESGRTLLQQDAWDAFRFVDLCQAAAGGDANQVRWCQEVARAEWELLFDHCFRSAVGH